MEWEKGKVSSFSARDSFKLVFVLGKSCRYCLGCFLAIADSNPLPFWFRTFLRARNLLSEQYILAACREFRYPLNGAWEVSRIGPIVQFLEFGYEIVHPLL